MKITGTFLDEISHDIPHQNWGRKEWDQDFAAMKSIGHTLYEDMKLDENGKCINANLTDYGAPMIGEAPEDFKSVLIDVNDEFGPFGAKSISEIACNGAAPAIGIAIHDACGVWMRSWPMTPEKLLHELGRI